jgi:predicted MFS family arabinose efflux permease
MVDLGLTVNNAGTITPIRELDTVLFDLPDIVSSAGSIFVNVDNDSSQSAIQSLVDSGRVVSNSPLTISIAVALLLGGELVLTFGSFSVLPVFLALVLFFGGFNFLEAGLPARLSLLADGETRGASLGVFSSSQFLGAFAGGLIGGRYLASGRPADVFFVCALLAGIWLALQGFSRSGDEA